MSESVDSSTTQLVDWERELLSNPSDWHGSLDTPLAVVNRSFPGGLSDVAKKLNAEFDAKRAEAVPVKKPEPKNPDAVLTYAQLEEHDACDNSYTFRDLWGDSVEVTPELAKKYAGEFDWAWAASNLLPTAVYRLWEKGQKVAREQHKAMVSKEDYRHRYLPNGAKRMRFTELQRERHADRMDVINNWFREQQAVTFAKMYVNRHRTFKTSKTEKMLEEFVSKVDNLVRAIETMNTKEQFKEDWEIMDILGGRLRDIARRVS